jgi:hypothetical protein
MGTMSYNNLSVQFDDRVLAHLHVVIIQKFRSRQSFAMSWVDGTSSGSGRTVIWLTPDLPIVFKFLGNRTPAIDRRWLDLLTASAESSTGLIVTDERGVLVKSTGTNLRG